MNDIDDALDLANCMRQKWLYLGPWRWPFRFYMYFICNLMTFYNTDILCWLVIVNWESKTHGSNLIFVKMAQLLPLIFFRLPTQIPNNLSLQFKVKSLLYSKLHLFCCVEISRCQSRNQDCLNTTPWLTANEIGQNKTWASRSLKSYPMAWMDVTFLFSLLVYYLRFISSFDWSEDSGRDRGLDWDGRIWFSEKQYNYHRIQYFTI